MPAYAEVAVQLPVPGTYCYAIPRALQHTALSGCRVLVSFGNRSVTGVVVATSDAPPDDVESMHALDALLDDTPQIDEELLALCMWVASYYEAPPGEVLRAALPVGARVKSQLTVELTERGRAAAAGEGGALSRRHRELLGALTAAGGGLPQPALIKGRGRVADVTSLVDTGHVVRRHIAERARVRARSARFAVLNRPVDEATRAALSRAPKRLAVLEALADASGAAAVAELKRENPRAADHLRVLARAGLVSFETREVAPVARPVSASAMSAAVTPPVLTAAQTTALAQIQVALEARAFCPFLLHGVTGSGKTEVYLHAIAEVLGAGRGAIVLVPEISLTPQLGARFRARFGDKVAVLHSALGDRERFDEWQRLRTGHARIALGARSAVFAPVTELGIIVVDEEHDSSFKQEEGVRYHARDVALVRAKRAHAACILGSATPSLESYRASEVDRYTLLELPERATPKPLPSVEVIDLKVFQAETEGMLTAPLADALGETLAAGEQAILFLNRRGFDTFVVCRACGEAFRCQACSVSLTYHRDTDRLLCHYCGYWRRVPDTCPACAADGSIVRRGLGTEKVATAVADRFPGARVARLDRDVASGSGIEEVLSRVARREVDVLVGTQMVTKGHDFPAVTLVGVLCADTGLSLPDFRAAERTFQLLTQVAGRAGRGDRPGRVLIQSYRGTEIAVTAAAAHDYAAFYRAECESRSELGYPPFGHLIAIRVDGPSPSEVAAEARRLGERASALRRSPEPGISEVTVLGPSEAPLARLKGRSRWHLWVRAPARGPLRQFVRALVADPDRPRSVRVTVDVDPVSAL